MVINSIQSLTLLKTGSGTNTTAAAANVDTYAVSGLTAKDRLWIVWSLESVTQATAGPLQLYSVTDAAVITALLAGGVGLGIGDVQSGQTFLNASQVDNKKISIINTTALGTGAATAGFISSAPTMTTLFTGAWTLALRHSGVTAGGTLYWQWSIYKVAGQN